MSNPLGSPPRIGLLQLCFIVPPRDCLGHRVRQGQVDALVGLVPLTIIVNVFAALVLAACLWRDAPKWQVATWFGTFLF